MEDNLAVSIIMKWSMLSPPTNTSGNSPLGIYADIENYIYTTLFIKILLVTAKTETNAYLHRTGSQQYNMPT